MFDPWVGHGQADFGQPLVGFQAVGTRGRALLDGQPNVKIHGRYVPVRAEVCDLTGFSVHADRSELLAWVRSAVAPPEGVFVVHGEPQAAAELRRTIDDELGWTAVTPVLGERVTLRPTEGRPADGQPAPGREVAA